MYDGHLLYVEWNDEEQRYDVWYDTDHIGTVKDREEAHDLMVNYQLRNV